MKSQLEVALHQHKALEEELERSRAEAEQQVAKSRGHNSHDDDNFDNFDNNEDDSLSEEHFKPFLWEKMGFFDVVDT